MCVASWTITTLRLGMVLLMRSSVSSVTKVLSLPKIIIVGVLILSLYRQRSVAKPRAYVKLLFSRFYLLNLAALLVEINTRLYAHTMGHHGSTSRHPQSRKRLRLTRGSTAMRRQIRLSVNRIMVGPPVPANRPADREQLPGCGHRFHSCHLAKKLDADILCTW